MPLLSNLLAKGGPPRARGVPTANDREVQSAKEAGGALMNNPSESYNRSQTVAGNNVLGLPWWAGGRQWCAGASASCALLFLPLAVLDVEGAEGYSWVKLSCAEGT